MKKQILTYAAGAATLALFAFTAVNYEAKKNTAEVEQYEGIYIFVDSKPVVDYKYIGTVKLTISLGGSQYTDIRNKIIKKAKQDFPNAEGIIITFNSGGADKADAITFEK